MLVQTKGRTGWHANTGSFMSLEEKQAAALRQRRRAFLDEVATIKKRQGGITKSQEQILEGVY